MSFDDLFRSDQPSKTPQRTNAGVHWGLTYFLFPSGSSVSRATYMSHSGPLPQKVENRESRFGIEFRKTNTGSAFMLNTNKAFSSFSVNDIQKAKEFYGETLGLELSGGPEGTLIEGVTKPAAM
jgi:hypothetical protein